MRTSLSLIIAMLGACALPVDEQAASMPDGKGETGYLSTLALEYHTTVEGEIDLPLGAVVENEISLQVRHAMRQLVRQGLHLNLATDALDSLDRVAVSGTTATYRYRFHVEGLITHEELRSKWGLTDPRGLRQRRIGALVPRNVRSLYQTYGERCAAGYVLGELGEHNYFYYFDPLPGCDVATTPLAISVENLAAEANPYPEYDRLIADRELSVVAFFGAVEHGEQVRRGDQGMREWRDFIKVLKQLNFQRIGGDADEPTGKGRIFRRYANGLTVKLSLFSPRDLQLNRATGKQLFARMVRENELVMYMGHSFYGSLDVLDEPATYDPAMYQIIMVASCWSYEYYTKQVLKHHPLADVVNDTESGWAMNAAEFAEILLTNIVRGSETQGRLDAETVYSWREIINRMNVYAQRAYSAYLHENPYTNVDHHEIMGVSGVLTNVFQPAPLSD